MNNITSIPYLQIIEQTQKTPNALAVLTQETQLTYIQLHYLSNQVAHYLRSQGIGRNSLVGIMTQRGPLMLIGILGIVKAGGAYVPLDPDYPAERIGYILNHAEIEILITESAVKEQLNQCLNSDLSLQTLLFLDEGTLETTKLNQVNINSWNTLPQTDPKYINESEDLMTVLYTSGSTGRPKGVMLNHQGYMNRLDWMQKTFNLHPGERVAQKTSFCFDISVWELFWTLMTGATICPVPRETVLNPWEFAQWINDVQINIMHFVPSLFGEFISALANENWEFPSLRTLVFSGEALPLAFVQRWIDKYGMKTQLANLYGPTEASIDVTYHIINERPDEKITPRIPIGKAIDNVYLKILDEQMLPVSPGEIGRLWIGGIQLAKGYLKDKEKTAKAFVPNPFPEIPGEYIYHTGDLAKELPDGSVEYHGRSDHQVKLRGFRVELGEVESVLNNHPAIKEVAVVVVNYGGQQKLVACLSGEKINNRQLKEYVGLKLPYYMIPQRFNWFASLPKNHNGKLDRKALQAHFDKPKPSQAQPPVTVQAETSSSKKDIVLPLGPAQKWLVTYFEPPYQWLGYTRFRYHQPLNLEVFNQCLNLMVKRHGALRTVFENQGGKWQQREISSPPLVKADYFDGTELSFQQQEAYLTNQIKELSQTMKLEQFPLIKTCVLKINPSCYEIVLIAHHIIADMLTTKVLFQELWSAYDEFLTTGNCSKDKESVVSYSDYLRFLLAEEDKGTFKTHLDYWQSQFPSPEYNLTIPLDRPDGMNIEASRASKEFIFGPDQTKILLRWAKKYYGTQTYILLLAPLYQLLADWCNNSWVVVSHRSHGRDLGNNQMFWDTIGNFAVNFPVGITLDSPNQWQQIIQQLHTQFEQLPANGVTFDWISDHLPNYIYPDSQLTPIRANYLGNRTLPTSELFEFNLQTSDKRLSPPEQKRTTLLEFFFSILNGNFHLEIEYSRDIHNSETIDQLGNHYLKLITSLLTSVPTPSPR